MHLYIFCFVVFLFGGVSASATQLPDVVVSQLRTEKPLTPIPSAITVITQDDIRLSGATQLTELLHHESQLQIRDPFGDGSRAVLSLRGFGDNASSNTLVLLDGRKLNESDLAAPDLSTIDLHTIERIEIINGSASVLFGDQAVGGVINIITKTPDETQLRLSTTYGSYTTWAKNFTTNITLSDSATLSLIASHHESDNYRAHNHTKRRHAHSKYRQDLPQGRYFFEIQATDELLELPGALSNQAIERSRTQAANVVDFSQKDDLLLRSGGLWFLNDNWSVEGDAAYRTADIKGILSNTNFTQARRGFSVAPRTLMATWTSQGEVLLTTGIDFEHNQYELFTRFGETQSNQTKTAAYSQLTLPIRTDLSFNIGARYAYRNTNIRNSGLNNLNISDDAWGHTIGLYYEPTNQLTVYGKREQNFRFPKLDEQTFTATTPLGDSIILEPQTGISYELGTRYVNDTILLDANIFYLVIEDEIEFDPNADNRFGLKGANNNLDKTKRKGASLTAEYLPFDDTTLSLNYTYTDARLSSGVLRGNRIPFVAEHRLTGRIRYQIMPHITLNGSFHTLSDRHAISDINNIQRKIGGRTIFDATVLFTYQSLNASLSVHNITNKQTHEFVSLDFNNELAFFPAPDRRVFLKLSYRIF